MVYSYVSESADETDFALAGFPPVEERSGPGKYFFPQKKVGIVENINLCTIWGHIDVTGF